MGDVTLVEEILQKNVELEECCKDGKEPRDREDHIMIIYDPLGSHEMVEKVGNRIENGDHWDVNPDNSWLCLFLSEPVVD